MILMDKNACLLYSITLSNVCVDNSGVIMWQITCLATSFQMTSGFTIRPSRHGILLLLDLLIQQVDHDHYEKRDLNFPVG